ncbi:MAG: DNA polymerase III subunit beta [Pseudomonadota bacterium]
MKITLDKESLSFLLGNMWHVADKRSTMRILSCVLFQCSKDDSTLKLATSNIKNTIQQKIKIDNGFDGGFAVQAKAIYDVVRVLPENEVEIERYKDDRIKITSGKYNVRIPVLSEEEFPSLPEMKKLSSKKQFYMSSKQLERMIEHTGFSISDDETRPYINGALFESDKDNVKMVTTDGHRMTIYKEEFKDGKLAKNKILIPLPGIMELKKFLALGEDKAQVTIEQATMHFEKTVKTPMGRDVDICLSVRLTDSEFPPYDSVIPRSNDKSCTCNRQTLLEAVRRVSILSSERYRTINIHLSENTATLRAEYADMGETEETMEVGYGGEPLSIGFNSSYVVNVLSALTTDQIEVRFGGELDGAIFKPVENDDFIGIVMPIRI